MSGSFFQNTPKRLYKLLDFHVKSQFDCSRTFKITAVPTGNPSGSVMLLIFIGGVYRIESNRIFKSGNNFKWFISKNHCSLHFCEDKIHLYTGQFKECKRVLRSKVIQHYKDRINDIYVDNTMAALVTAWPLDETCDQIIQIVRYDIFCIKRVLMCFLVQSVVLEWYFFGI